MLKENKIIHIISLGFAIFTLMCLLPSFLPSLIGHGRETLAIGFVISICTYIKISRSLFHFDKLYNISNFIDVENVNKQNVSGVKISPVKTRFWEFNFDILEKYKSERRKVLNVILLGGLISFILFLGGRTQMTNLPLICFIAFCSFRISTWGQILAFLYINLVIFALGFSVNQSSHVLSLIFIVGIFFVLQKFLVSFHWWKIARTQSRFVFNLKGSLSIIMACCFLSLILSSVLNPKLNLVKSLFDFYEKLSASSKVIDKENLPKEITVKIPNLEKINQVKSQKLNPKDIEKIIKGLDQEIKNISEGQVNKDFNQKVKVLQNIQVKLKLKGGKTSKKFNPMEIADLERLIKEFSSKAKSLSKDITLKKDRKKLEQISVDIEKIKNDTKTSDDKINEIKNKLKEIDNSILASLDKKSIVKTETMKKEIKKLEKKNKELKEKRIWQRTLILLGLFSLFLYIKNLFLQKRVIHSGIQISDKIKNELKAGFRNIHKRYPTFKDEVLAKYQFFHLVAEKTHFDGSEAPPSVVIGRELNEKKMKEVAFELSHFFDKAQFNEKKQFSKKEVKQFRKSFSLFEKIIKNLLK